MHCARLRQVWPWQNPHASNRRTRSGWMTQSALLICLVWLPAPPGTAAAEQRTAQPAVDPSQVLRLSLTDAIGLFLKQNFDLLIARYGIDTSKGAEVTARLFPNPLFSLIGTAAFTQGQTFRETRSITPQIEQLFLIAGKRGYRIESAEQGVRTAEAGFEDALRLLGLTVKETYFRVQLARAQLALAQDNQRRFERILAISDVRFKKGFISELDLIRLRLQKVDFDAQVIAIIQELQAALGDLRVFLGLSPSVELVLDTELAYRRVEPDVSTLRQQALESRPDLRVKRHLLAQRQAELKLAKAFRYPDPVVGGSYNAQGPRGPDNQQMYGLSFSVPLPIFDRNQGGIIQAEATARMAQAEVEKILVQVQNEVDVAHGQLVQSRTLVEAYRGRVLENARMAFSIVEQAYQKGGVTLIDLLDAVRTSLTIQQDYLEALYRYQQSLFRLESATGQEITA